MQVYFHRFSRVSADLLGSSWAFMLSLAIVVLWGVVGPYFRYSDTWQLVINTGTTVVTFWMVFLLQHTQNADSQAIHVKLDELIRAVKAANNSIIAIEHESEQELQRLTQEHRQLRLDAEG